MPDFYRFLPKKISEYPNFYDIARKINKSPEFYMIFAQKNYQNTLIFMIFARKINKVPNFT